jgi:hypothetical protein
MVGGQGQGLTLPLPQMLHRRRRVGTSPTRVNKRNRVSPLCSLWVGRSQDPPMAQRVQDAGGSEGGAVIASIRVQNLPGVQTSRLPAGVSSRGNRRNNAEMGWRVSPSGSAFEMLERYAVKVARTVLRGGSGSNATPLPDHRTAGSVHV